MTHPYSIESDGFHIRDYQGERPFSSFLPGIAGECGKPMWVFYTNRGQCIASFGVRDKNGAMLEFHPANKAYALTPLYGFRTFIRIADGEDVTLYEAFQHDPSPGVAQRMIVRPHEVEIEETHPALGLCIRVVYFTLPNERLPALVRRVTVQNTGLRPLRAEVLDGLPQIVPYGLEERLLKLMSRTMEAFAEIRHVEDQLPFFKLQVEPSDKPEVQWINGGFFAFAVQGGRCLPIVTDPDQVFGADTSLRTPQGFLRRPDIDPLQGRRATMTGCAFARLTLSLEPQATTGWDAYFGQASAWELADALRARATGNAQYSAVRRNENAALVARLSAQFALVAGPAQLDAYTRQAFLDNTLRGGEPMVVEGPHGPRVFHTFTRKHGDMERDYNFFELAPSYFSQGNGNFRDVNQNRRSENFIFQAVGISNIETFFNLLQLDGNNPLVIESETFRLPAGRLDALLQAWPAGDCAHWRSFLQQPFSPGRLMEMLVDAHGTPEMARPWFERVVGQCDKVQGASHGEGYWVDHWTYNLDLLQSYAALYPDRLGALLRMPGHFSYFDNAHRVQPRTRKYVLRADGTVRQLHAVVLDTEHAALISQRAEDAHAMRSNHGTGAIYRTSLLAKMVNLLAVKATLLDPSGIGLEMESEKPGWCDALNGLPGLFGSSTHEAQVLRRWGAFVRAAVCDHLAPSGSLVVPAEVAALVRSVTELLRQVDPTDFLPTWDRLASCREAFREDTGKGVSGTQAQLDSTELLRFVDAVDQALEHGLAKAVDAHGLPVSYYTHEVLRFEVLSKTVPAAAPNAHAPGVPVRATAFLQKPLPAFLEGQVHALRSLRDPAQARALYRKVRASPLFDPALGMYRVNAPLQDESFEIGRSRIFSPGWLENASIFLHMHYKYLLETLRSGLAVEFFDDLRRGLVAFHDPAVYGRSPLENSSFIASSSFADARAHGVGFVARLSGATAEWISMVLHMGLGAMPFRVVDGALRFEPRPTLADWLFTTAPSGDFSAGSFGFKLFGHTWIVYQNSAGQATYGASAVSPVAFELHYVDGRRLTHATRWLTEELATDLRDGKLTRLTIRLA